MFEILWGIKTEAIFDVWTLEHLLSGISVGAGCIVYNKKHLGQIFASISEKVIHPKRINFLKYKYDILAVLFVAFLWETIEHYLETSGGIIEYWFQGVEFWPNRIIADPLMLVFGYLIAKKNPSLIWPARILSLLWILVHIFVFPHSMYLHEIF